MSTDQPTQPLADNFPGLYRAAVALEEITEARKEIQSVDFEQIPVVSLTRDEAIALFGEGVKEDWPDEAYTDYAMAHLSERLIELAAGLLYEAARCADRAQQTKLALKITRALELLSD